MIHGERASGKAHGVVNTKPEVVSKMLDLAEYKSTIAVSYTHLRAHETLR